MSHGYEVRLTPLQILTFYNAIANNGRMVKPKFVDELRFHGRLVKSFDTEIIDHAICSRSTLIKAKTLLRGVVENGTAKNLNISEFTIAGKTGTSQIFNVESGTYRSENGISYQSSFVGYFPAENPKYSCIVIISSPSKSVYHGSAVAGPVFLEIARKVHSLDFDYAHASPSEQYASADLPYSKDGLKSDLVEVANKLDITIAEKKPARDWVSTTKKESAIEITSKELIPNLVPDVVMMGAKDAVFLLENAGLKVIIKGRGSVKSQSIPPGTRIKKGDVIELEMSFI
jgi:cell division protein FtsI (penicillin-binding protein 3)